MCIAYYCLQAHLNELQPLPWHDTQVVQTLLIVFFILYIFYYPPADG